MSRRTAAVMKPFSSLSRREMLRVGVAAAAAALAQHPWRVFGLEPTAEEGRLIPFLDQQPVGKSAMLRWEQLKSWITPNPQVYQVQHYGVPEPVDRAKWRLEIGGLVRKPAVFTLDQLKARRHKSVIATLECSGNSSSTGFMGAIGNVEWIGTPLAPLLEECGPLKRGIEVVFFGGDEKIEKVREKDYLQNFTRSLHVSDALRDEVLLCWEMNGEPLTQGHGAPVRLVVPGWFGIAWVKWLHRIEVMDHRYMSKYMAREYVTLRGEERGGKTVWHETSVGPINTKSIIARAARLPAGPVRLTGAAWTDGTPLERVEVRIDDGPWRPATLSKKPRARYAWRFFEFEWTKPEPGEHLVVSRAIDAEGRIQPPASDPSIRLKKTYWEASQQWPRRIRIEA
jgi:DMSO/TMAO reductase YedYZ molybdopterin-dependent catalytic subunit